MTDADAVDRMAEACLRAHELVKAHGTAEMKVIADLLLHEIGREIARRTFVRHEQDDSD